MRIKTGYSFRVAVGHLSEVVSRIKEIGWKVAPISDYASTFGFNRFTKLAVKAGLRPIYGVELNVSTALNNGINDRWTFFAKSSLRPLHDLISLATENCNGDPSITYKMALEAKDLIKIAGERFQIDFIKKPPAKDFYIGLSGAIPKALFNEALRRKFKFIATGNNVFPRESDLEFYRVALGDKRSSTQIYPQHILSDEEWERSISHIAPRKVLVAAIKNREGAMKECRAAMKRASLLIPKKPKTLEAMCIEGARRTGTNLNDPVYKARLKRELDLIAEKKFEDYFYVIADLVNWAKERMIVGPARGSSCGSLVCYLLNITTIDPIPFGLIFERFIDTTRTDLPDIDIDFSDARRKLVFEYAEDKFGIDRVARLGTVGLFKPRSALNQAGIALQIPRWQVEKVLDGLIERSSGDARAMLSLEDTLNETEAGRTMLSVYPEVKIAARMEGHPNVSSQHAAGIVVTEKPVVEYVAVDRRTKAAMVDKKDAEDLNLLKIDALGLTQLSIFERTLELIGKPSVSGWLETLPLNDKKAFKVLNDGHFAGIFQFTGMSLQSLVKQIEVKHIDDMISITALARPGPLATGGANLWVLRKNGRDKIKTIHPMLTELTKETLGIVIYQETVMNIVRQMGKFSWDDTSAIRKAMSGRLGDEFFAKYRISFIKGAAENNIDEKIADEVWRHINTMGSWAFNKSHAVAYGLVSYWCCYLKAHHPIEFAAATLDAEVDPAKQIMLLRELKAEGVDYVPVDPDHSVDRWVPMKKEGKSILVGPLTSIKGIGPAKMIKILDARKSGEPLREGLRKQLAAAKTEIDSLYPIADKVKELAPKFSPYPKQTPISELEFGKEFTIVGLVKKISPRDKNESVSVAKRGGTVLSGPHWVLNMFVADDTGEVFVNIGRNDYERLAKQIIDRGRAGKVIYSFKGKVPNIDFKMLSVESVRYLGSTDGREEENERPDESE